MIIYYYDDEFDAAMTPHVPVHICICKGEQMTLGFNHGKQD